MPYYLGIDGGGTKTRCLLADETTVLAKAMTGGSNIVRLGEQQAREALHSAIRRPAPTPRFLPIRSAPSVSARPALPGPRSPRRFAASSPS
jgi:N-acetylglucosamine kinase-like BadF-type ATPase